MGSYLLSHSQYGFVLKACSHCYPDFVQSYVDKIRLIRKSVFTITDNFFWWWLNWFKFILIDQTHNFWIKFSIQNHCVAIVVAHYTYDTKAGDMRVMWRIQERYPRSANGKWESSICPDSSYGYKNKWEKCNTECFLSIC